MIQPEIQDTLSFYKQLIIDEEKYKVGLKNATKKTDKKFFTNALINITIKRKILRQQLRDFNYTHLNYTLWQTEE